MRGTIVNAAAILIGSGIGLAAGSHVPERFRRIITTSLGLATLLIGVQMALKAESVLVVIAGLVIGGVVGEWLDIEGALERVGDRLKSWARAGSANGIGKPEATRKVAGCVISCESARVGEIVESRRGYEHAVKYVLKFDPDREDNVLWFADLEIPAEA